jgi:hypothetical protein
MARRSVTLASLLLGVALALSLPAPRLAAAELQAAASQAYDRYLEEATRAFLDRRAGILIARGKGRSIHEIPLKDGEVIARPAQHDGIIDVPGGGLVHHWLGQTFIGGATLSDTLRISYAYDDYDAFYKPVIASELLGKEGDAYRVRLRIKEGAAGVSAVLDVTARVRYFFPETGTGYSLSRAEEIRELKDHGSTNERLLPPGQGSGYLWKAATLNRFVERKDGVLVEMETVGLSRSFPPLLGWLIEPVARRLGRQSVERSLQEFRDAVRARQSG